MFSILGLYVSCVRFLRPSSIPIKIMMFCTWKVRAQMWDEDVRGENGGATYSGYTVFAGETVYAPKDYWEVGYKVLASSSFTAEWHATIKSAVCCDCTAEPCTWKTPTVVCTRLSLHRIVELTEPVIA